MVTYTTPVTEAEFDTLINGISWPNNCEDHAAAYADLLARLRAIVLGWQALNTIRLHVAKDDAPTLNDWQTAWTRTGRELPITGNVMGLHTSLTTTPAEYGEYFWKDGEMKPLRARWWQGSTEFINTFPSSHVASLGTSEQKVFEFPVAMKRPGWIDFVTPLSVVYTTTDTAVRWRTSQETANTTYGLLRTRINTLTAMVPAMVHAIVNYAMPSRLSSAFTGNIEFWARKEASTVEIGSQDTLTFLDYLPNHAEITYD